MKMNLLAALLVVFSTAAAAGDKEDIAAVIRQFTDGLNKGDRVSLTGACATETSIIDEFAPYEWHGAGACAKWADDFDADAKKNGITEPLVTMGATRHNDVTGDRAYVVMSSTYSFKQQGKSVEEKDATFTAALQKGAAGWRITGWTWSKP
jgi:hypothetical protein